MIRDIILTRLFDKYEKSKHLLEPGTSNRRVMLRIDKKELPEYDFENASIRDTYNETAVDLQNLGLVALEWVKGRPVLSAVILNLDNVLEGYRLIGRIHPKELANMVCQTVSNSLANISTDWIAAWRDAVCADAQESWKVPAYCKDSLSPLKDILKAFAAYDSLHGEVITMRAFSSKCFHDSKYFERNVRDMFLRAAQKYNTGFAEACDQEELGVRDQLAFLGIYMRPELYELSGNCTIRMLSGIVDVAASVPFGLALPSTSIDAIMTFDLHQIHKVVFIENKTNYDEYILSEEKADELVIYHGGFLSPQKRKLFSKIAACIPQDMQVVFWADIDLGGFRMFAQLQQLIPMLLPTRMSAEEVEKYHHSGLVRPANYLDHLESSIKNNAYPLFSDAIRKILEYGVTIEQEVFLSE